MRYFPNLSRDFSGCLILFSPDDVLRLLDCLSSAINLPSVMVELHELLASLSSGGDYHD